MTVFTYENSRRGGACREFIEASGRLSGYETLTILPIPTSRDGVRLTGSEKTLASVIEEAREGEIYLGYAVPDFMKRALCELGAVVIDAEKDEEFLRENARLTALATLAYLLSDSSVAPDGLDIGIVGYGRIGRALARLLVPLGGGVRVYSTRKEVVHCLCSSGIDATLVEVGAPLPDADILINTAPAAVFEPDSPVRPDMKILELAGGDNFGSRDITRLPALPNRYFPVSAGRAYGAALLRALGGGK